MLDDDERISALAAAVASAIDAEAFNPPPQRAASSKKSLRLASTRRALLLDTLAVVARVRPAAMLDFCPGLEPGAAAAVAAAASEAFSSSSTSCSTAPHSAVVVAAHLDGCCYLLSTPLLGDAGPPRPPPQSSSAAAAAGAFARTVPWPIVFRGQPLCPRLGESEVEGKELAVALAPLSARISEVARSAAAEVPSSSSAPSLPFVDLDSIQTLPAAPALNAFLLGYPVAYSVSSRDEAALASRALRSGGSGGGKTGLALVTMTAPSPPLPSSSVSPDERWKVCSFSIPLSLWEEVTGGEEKEDDEKEAEAEAAGPRKDFISLWAESARASAVFRSSSSSSSSDDTPLSSLFRGQDLRVSVKFVDSSGVTM